MRGLLGERWMRFRQGRSALEINARRSELDEMMLKERYNKIEFAGGGVTILIGIGIVAEAMRYRLGTLTSMGPGMFPIILGIILIILGFGILWEARRASPNVLLVPLRPIIYVSVAIIAFGMSINRLGLIPALVFLTVISSFADKEFDWKPLIITLIILILMSFVFLTLVPNAFNLQLINM